MSETRTTIRLPDDLQRRLKEAAARNRRSVHAEILVRIERGLDEERDAHFARPMGMLQPATKES